LGKGSGVAALERRLAALEALAARRPWMAVKATEHQLLVDACEGYDAVVLGADKWLQITDPAWYGSAGARDAAVAALPPLLLAPRPPWDVHDPCAYPLPSGTVLLDLDPAYSAVSSTAVRGGRTDWLAGDRAYGPEQRRG
jgi:hypothetical protein